MATSENDSGQLPWERLAKLLLHPLSLAVLELAVEHREAGGVSPKMASDQLGERLGNVSYHVRKLHGLGLLVQAAKEPRRGAVEHFYLPAFEEEVTTG